MQYGAPSVVIPIAEAKLLVIPGDALTDRVGFRKFKWSTCNRTDLPGRNHVSSMGVNRPHRSGERGENVALPPKVKVRVIRQG